MTLEDETGVSRKDVADVIRKWRPFLDVVSAEGSESLFRLYHPSFREFVVETLGIVSTSADKYGTRSPIRSHLLSAGRPFLDREVLRRSVRDMMGPAGRRMLVVNGPPASGKSYTLLFIEHVARQTGAFQVAPVILDRADVPAYKLIDLARDLAMVMGLPGEPIPRQLGDTTQLYVRKFVQWLLGQAISIGSNWWVILDGFSSEHLNPDIRLLIHTLAKAIQRQSGPLWLILLDFDESLPDDVSTDVYWEQLTPPTDIGGGEIREFLLDLFNHAPDKTRLEDVDQVTISMLNGLPVGDERLGVLSRRLRELTETLVPSLMDEPS